MAIVATLRTHEHMGRLFWVSSATGTLAVATFAVLQGGAEGFGLLPDVLLLAAVAAAAVGYAEGGRLAGQKPGWQVISWALVLVLPVTLPVFLARASIEADGAIGQQPATAALVFLALVPQYMAFFAFYAGLARAGVARASQTQLLQPLLTLGWAVLLLGEGVGPGTILAATAVVLSVAGTQRARLVGEHGEPVPSRGNGDD